MPPPSSTNPRLGGKDPAASFSSTSRTRGRRRKPVQLSLPTPATWGGARRGAGRKPSKLGRPGVPHVPRDQHSHTHPVHITVRSRRERGSLRQQIPEAAVRNAITRSQSDDFRVVHYSIQPDHVHLLVEASSRDALSAGMRRLVIRATLGLNRALGLRRGKLWSGRHHRHALKTPREVRNAIVYVLANFKKHVVPADLPALDAFSSAIWFDGYAARLDLPIVDLPPRPVSAPRTWLLTVGWRRRGLVRFEECPRTKTPRSH